MLLSQEIDVRLSDVSLCKICGLGAVKMQGLQAVNCLAWSRNIHVSGTSQLQDPDVNFQLHWCPLLGMAHFVHYLRLT